MRFFISYSKIRDAVSSLKDDLELLFPECEVWFDQQMKGSGGQEWWDMICEAIRRCDVFIYALSPTTLDSEPCNREYQYARALNRPIIPPFLVPIDIARLPRDLQAAQLVDYLSPDNAKKRALRDSIRSLPRRELPNSLPPPPAIPLDPIGELFDRIRTLGSDSNAQKVLIVDIDDLRFDPRYAERRVQLLSALLRREDVLTVANYRRISELLETAPPPTTPQPAPPTSVAEVAAVPQAIPSTPLPLAKIGDALEPFNAHYDVILMAVGDQKINLIKVVRRYTDMDLATAKAFIEDVPQVILTGVSLLTATSAKMDMEEMGATVEITPSQQ